MGFRLGVFACLILLAAEASAAFRCGTSLVDEGDWPVEVRERCGEPDYVAEYPQAVLPGLGIINTIEHWYYNPGPGRFIRRLEFRDGRLHREDTMGYGFPPGAPGPCKPRLIREGLSEFEVAARCGEPLSRRGTWYTPPDHRPRDNAVQATYPVEEWLYGFGSTEFRRVVTLRNGRVIEVKTADKPQ